MSVLEVARKAYAKLVAQRNGHPEGEVCPHADCEISERSEVSPPLRRTA